MMKDDLSQAAQFTLNRVRKAWGGKTRNPGKRQSTPGNTVHGDGSLRDPLTIPDVLDRFLADRGWQDPVAVGSVMVRWPGLVGEEIAKHCIPESFSDAVLVIRCDSTAWATQLRLMNQDILATIAQELGPGVVSSLKILGPTAPSWRKGARSVAGPGPRDTYG